jgi:hypothetical protein
MAFRLPNPNATPVRVRTSISSGDVPVAAELEEGEIALNSADGRVFFKNPSGEVQSTEDVPTVTALGEEDTTVNTDCSLGTIFDVTLTGNVTFAAPTNPVDGMTVRWRVRQDGVGSRTVTLNGVFRIPSSGTSPLAWSTTASAMDVLAATYNATDTKWDIVAFVPGY